MSAGKRGELGEGDAPAVEARVLFTFPLSLWAQRNQHGTLETQRTDGGSVRRFEVHQVEPFLRWLLSLEGEGAVAGAGRAAGRAAQDGSTRGAGARWCMNAQRDTADAQLERILYILPVAARGTGVALDTLARELHVTPQTILRDLQQATDRAFYHPPGTVDPFTITILRNSVHVHAPQEFTRPARLNEREALALALGLRTLAGEAEEPRRAEILGLATRLEAQLVAPDASLREEMPAYRAVDMNRVAEQEVEYDALALAFDDDGFRGVVADAIELGRMCTIWYLKPGDLGPMHRRIAPYRLMHANGMWYVAAYDEEREALRFFRMDRVLDAALLDTQSPPAPPELDAAIARGAPYSGTDEVDVSVRYSPRASHAGSSSGHRRHSSMTMAPPCSRIASRIRAGSCVMCCSMAARRWWKRRRLRAAGSSMPSTRW